MASFQCGRAIVERCLQCKGIWFDRREIAEFRSGLEAQDLEGLPPLEPAKDDGTYTISTCPDCAEQLVDRVHAVNSKVKIRACSKCDGIWMPGTQIENFAHFVRISQSIAADVAGMLREQEGDRRRGENLAALGETMGKKISASDRLAMNFHYHFGLSLILPLYDENRRDAFPWATLGLILVNLLVFFSVAAGPETWNLLGLIPADVLRGEKIYSLVSSLFLHSGWFHLVANLYFLWLFGDNIEDLLGIRRYLILYFLAGLFAAGVHIAFNPASTIPAIGASGAIAGVLGAYFVLFPGAVVNTLVFGRIFRLHIGFYVFFWALMNLAVGLGDHLAGSSAGGIAWAAHVGGLVGGILFVHFFRIRRKF